MPEPGIESSGSDPNTHNVVPMNVPIGETGRSGSGGNKGSAGSAGRGELRLAGSGGGPHDPGMEARLSILEAKVNSVEAVANRLEGRLDGIDVRLRGVEVSLGRLEGKIDALTGTIVGQTSAALAKLPSWWQMPAVIGSTVVLLVALYTAYRVLQAHALI